MTAPEPVRIRRALLSVWDKNGLTDLGAALAAAGVELIASGGTAGALAEALAGHFLEVIYAPAFAPEALGV
ncbi:MAG: hypothetical protein ABR559_01755, partial [Gemmatimonadota bacterium]